MEIKKGDWVRVPRFGSVRIARILEDEDEAWKEGFTEPTDYREDPRWYVAGHSLGTNRMEFGAYRR